jgi:superfamily II DNA or RNA helicase
VNRTLQDQDFQRFIADIPGKQLLWIGDECHHHGSAGLARYLPANAAMRMGLSATPEHYIDQSANDRLTAYYGKIVAAFTLSDALRAGVLTPYRYQVVPVDLTAEETEEYKSLTTEIGRTVASGMGAQSENAGGVRLQALLNRRARLMGAAQNKLPELGRLLTAMTPQSHVLFYCGDGTVDDDDVGLGVRQIEAVSEVLHACGWKTSRFTSREGRPQRISILGHGGNTVPRRRH